MEKKEKANIKELFSLNLTRLRREAGLAQVALAQKAGLTHNFINDLENCKKGFSLETLSKLAEALDAEPMDFFININQWENIDKQKYVSILNSINKNVNKIFDDYRNKI